MQETAPNRNCDIVMKGGITSGVVYPLAIVKLADEFRFRNIGGTSAGAIAAAVAAAAEYQRLTKKSADGFRRIADLPRFLSKDLLGLFPPTKNTRSLFRVALAFVGNRHVALKAVIAILPLLFASPLMTLLTQVPTMIVLAVLVRNWSALPAAAAAGLGGVALLAFVTGILVLALWVSVRAICFTIPRNGFGFSTGRAPEGTRSKGVTDWMDEEIQATAGKDRGKPLTFADLWTAEGASIDACRNDASLRSINLQMITTSLTHGRPYRLPFDDSRFLFRESEMKQYFPDSVVAHMVANATRDANDPDLYSFTETAEMPVVVAARMSLSFPILFTLVPFYSADYSTTNPQPERAWFIDGGLSSNFPVNLFDSPFPRWPTFGIDLSSPNEKHPIDLQNESANSWMVNRNSDGRSPSFHRFGLSGVRAVSGYVAAILDAIRNWRDNTQMSTPGFCDRVVHIRLDAQEGGLNLKMDEDKVTRLSKRGEFAAEKLLDHFGSKATHSMNWNNHRWVRYLIAMALLQNAMHNMHQAFDDSDPAFPSYADLVRRTENVPKTGYWWDDPQAYGELTDAFLAFAESVGKPSFQEICPKPKPELRITPSGV